MAEARPDSIVKNLTLDAITKVNYQLRALRGKVKSGLPIEKKTSKKKVSKASKKKKLRIVLPYALFLLFWAPDGISTQKNIDTTSTTSGLIISPSGRPFSFPLSS